MRAHRDRRVRTVASEVPITEIMSRHVVCASPDLPVPALVEVMIDERLGCVPVVDEHGHPIGMVTKRDLVEQLLARNGRPRPALVSDMMMPLAFTLDDRTTVAHATALMANEDMHHVMIVSGRDLVGVVSTMDVTRWLFENDGMPAV